MEDGVAPPALIRAINKRNSNSSTFFCFFDTCVYIPFSSFRKTIVGRLSSQVVVLKLVKFGKNWNGCLLKVVLLLRLAMEYNRAFVFPFRHVLGLFNVPN